MLPFGNLISQIQVKGSDVEKAFEHSLSADTETQDGKKVLGANGGFLQVSDSLRYIMISIKHLANALMQSRY